MGNYIKILDYNIFSDSKEEAIKEICKREKVHVISGNPEVLFSGLNNVDLDKNFKSEEAFIIPDGVGTQISAKLLRKPLKEKIAGIECLEGILKEYEKNGKSIYFLGAKEEVISGAVKKISEKYPRLIIKGYRNGYFNKDEEKEIIKDIKELNPNCLILALGCPKQERFAIKYMDELPCNIFMGVGGSLDILSGNLKRAPRWMINIGMEWLYRVVKEPFRIKRLGVIPKFIYIAYKNTK